MKKDEKKQDLDLKNFKDLSGVSLKEMNFGLWLSENRRRIMKIIIVFLIVISSFFFIYSSYHYVVYFLTGKTEIQTETLVSSPRNLIKEMTFEDIKIFKNIESSDLAIKIKNSNDNFQADFQYCFEINGQETACGTSFIFPQEDKYILALNQNKINSTDAVLFKIKDIFWSRINKRVIPDWNEFYSDHLNFLVENIEFSGASQSGLSEKINLNSLQFNVSNNTPFSYYEVPFNILLFSGNGLVGVHRYFLDNFISGEKREIRISWPDNLESVAKVEIVPDLNITDDTVFQKYQGEN